jgi:hypothetical protein
MKQRQLSILVFALVTIAVPATALEIAVSFTSQQSTGPLDGRVLVLLSTNDEDEPRNQIGWDVTRSMQVFGVDAEALAPGQKAILGIDTFGYPVRRLGDLRSGTYQVQAMLHRYDTFRRGDGRTLKLPASWEAGQRWNREPGNLFSKPRTIEIDAGSTQRIEIVLDQVIPPIEPLEDTRYIRHVRIKSQRLSEFWGRDMFLGAHVLVPEGFDDHPEARYPLMVFHGHFPANFDGFRAEPPDPDLECEFSERFQVECYNRVQQQEAYDFYRTWTGDDFPRFLIIVIQHANPFYDDSYAVNSANLGPYGDAITYDLIPHVEKRFRGIGEGWARFLYGGSTGGWEALAAQIFYPEEYNGAFGACPDPVDFRAYMTVNIYEDSNAYYFEGPFGRVERPAQRDYLGHLMSTIRDNNHLELAVGTHSRSGDQFDIWEAVYSPVGEDGYPARIWDKLTGDIDPKVAEHWRKYDLRLILEENWESLGPKLAGKLHIYCGDMDNYYLNNAVYLMEDFLESTENPYYAGEVEYGDRAEHCWNGDHENGNHLSRLRYNTFYVPKILERLESSAPEGADLESWRY